MSVIVHGPIEISEDCQNKMFYIQNLSIKDILGLEFSTEVPSY